MRKRVLFLLLFEFALSPRPGSADPLPITSGRFLLDMVNRDWILTHPQSRTWTQRDDGALLMEETSLDLVNSRVLSRQLLIDPAGGAQVTKQFTLRAYTCAELSALLRRHRFRVRDVLGGAGGEPYGVESRRLVIVSERLA